MWLKVQDKIKFKYLYFKKVNFQRIMSNYREQIPKPGRVAPVDDKFNSAAPPTLGLLDSQDSE